MSRKKNFVTGLCFFLVSNVTRLHYIILNNLFSSVLKHAEFYTIFFLWIIQIFHIIQMFCVFCYSDELMRWIFRDICKKSTNEKVVSELSIPCGQSKHTATHSLVYDTLTRTRAWYTRVYSMCSSVYMLLIVCVKARDFHFFLLYFVYHTRTHT